jgi:hypothetical protein
MDETARTILAYAVVITGLPILAARIIWVIPGTLSTKLLTHVARRLDQFADAAIEGFIALLLAGLTFEKLGLQPGWKIPLILIVFTLIWHKFMNELSTAWPALGGILIGFVCYPKVSLFLASLPNPHLWIRNLLGL